jgi:MFS family permease
MGREEDGGLFYGYVIVLMAFLIIVVMGGTMYSFGVFLKPVMRELGWTSAETSGAYSVFMVLHGLFYIFTGRLNDRFGPRVVTTICGLFLGFGYMFMSRISAIWHLYLFYGVIIALGMSGGYVPLVSTVARWFLKRRGLMTGITVAGVGVGTMVMPPVAGWLIEAYGWRFCYLMIGAFSLMVIVGASQFLVHSPAQMGQLPYGEAGEGSGEEGGNPGHEGGEGTGDVSEGLEFDDAIHSRRFWAFSGLWACFVFIVQAIMVHIVPYSIEQGLLETDSAAATVMSVIGLGSIIGRIIIGYLGDIIGNKLALILCFTLLLANLVFVLNIRGLFLLYLFAVIFGLAYGGHVPLGSPLTAELFGMRSHGTIFGVVTFIGTIGGAIGPLIAGIVFDLRKSYTPAFLICIAAACMGIILTKFLTQDG